MTYRGDSLSTEIKPQGVRVNATIETSFSTPIWAGFCAWTDVVSNRSEWYLLQGLIDQAVASAQAIKFQDESMGCGGCPTVCGTIHGTQTVGRRRIHVPVASRICSIHHDLIWLHRSVAHQFISTCVKQWHSHD
jgi:hypothetical protein